MPPGEPGVLDWMRTSCAAAVFTPASRRGSLPRAARGRLSSEHREREEEAPRAGATRAPTLEFSRLRSSKDGASAYFTSTEIGRSCVEATGRPSLRAGKKRHRDRVSINTRFNVGLRVGVTNSTVAVPSAPT